MLIGPVVEVSGFMELTNLRVGVAIVIPCKALEIALKLESPASRVFRLGKDTIHILNAPRGALGRAGCELGRIKRSVGKAAELFDHLAYCILGCTNEVGLLGVHVFHHHPERLASHLVVREPRLAVRLHVFVDVLARK